MTWELVPNPFEFTKNQAQTLLENETWNLIPGKLKVDYLKNKKKFKAFEKKRNKKLLKWSKKYFSLISKVLSFRHTKQTSNNSAYTTFKNEWLKRTLSKESY